MINESEMKLKVKHTKWVRNEETYNFVARNNFPVTNLFFFQCDLDRGCLSCQIVAYLTKLAFYNKI